MESKDTINQPKSLWTADGRAGEAKQKTQKNITVHMTSTPEKHPREQPQRITLESNTR